MGEWLIYGSNGTQKATVKKLEYSGEFMGETSVSCDIYSPSPISFSIGDYLVYRGERFTIDYDATRLKQARNDTYGKGYTYENMRFLSYVGELKKCEFLDFVPSDNLIHFSQLPDFSFYAETVKDLADRLQANLDRIYTGSKAWSVQVVQGFEGKENINVSVSKATCFDALRMAYDQFEATFIIRGRTITIGTAGSELETDFKYGKGNGLKTIERSVDESDSLVTRLRAYGNTTNLPANYYKNIGMRVYAPIYEIYHVSTTGCDIHFVPKLKNACFSDKNGQYSYWVTVSLDETLWLKAVASPNNHLSSTAYSVVTVGLYGSNTQAQVTQFLNQLQSGTYDKLYFKEGINVGAWPVEYREYAENVPNLMAIDRLMLPGFPELTTDPYIDASNISTLGVREKSVYFDGSDPDTPDIHPTLEGMTAAELRAAGYTIDLDTGDNGNLDEIAADATETDGSPITADGAFEGVDEVPGFKVTIKDIGFDINDYLSTETATLVMKTGMCGGREFTIVNVEKVGNKYVLECQRTEDVSHYFPYNPYLIKAGDKFVLTNIEMPKAYIDAASQRLLAAAQAYIAKYSAPQWVYAIKMDDIWMQRQKDNSVSEASSYYWNIKEGDVMNVTDSDLGVDIAEVIDRLSIREGFGPIPEFEVVLRKEKPQGTIGVLQNRIRQLELRNAEQVSTIYRQQNYIDLIIGDKLNTIQEQLDHVQVTYFGDYVPTLSNEPASTWQSSEYSEHDGDMFYNRTTGKGYEFTYKNGAWGWVEIQDEDIRKALEDASNAQDTADGKRRVFVTPAGTLPTPPYDENDLWVNATYPSNSTSTDESQHKYYNDILKCVTPKTEGGTASINDWTLASKYTDDSSLNAFINGSYADDLEDIQNQIDGKAETWYQSTDPSTAWTTTALKNQHKGDIWHNSSNTTINGVKAGQDAIWNGTAWVVDETVPQSVYDTIDGKAAIYVTWGAWGNDLQVKDLFIPSANTTQGGVTYKANKVYRCTNKTTPTFQEIAYTDDAALNAFLNGYTGTLTGIRQDITNAATAASNAQTSANNASSAAAAAQATADALDYLKQAYLADNTLIDHGLILSTIVALRDSSNNVWSGISGAYDSTKLGNGIAAWYGGGMIDKEVSAVSNAAKSLFRFDGSGYVADGNLSWDKNGNVTIQGYSINATTLQVGGANVATQAMLDNFVSKAFFNRLFTAYDANGNAIVPNNTTTAINNLKIMVGAWTEQYLSALGLNSEGGGGGTGDVSHIKIGTNPDVFLDPDEDGIIDMSSYAANWNDAYQKRHTHSNKSVLDGITSTKVSHWDAVYGVVPSAAYESGNSLADKNFVNSSISTATATFRGTVTASNDTDAAAATALATITTKDLNDYAFVKVENTPQTGVDKYKRYKYDGSSWVYEYTLNNSSFTSDQWNAINSGITTSLVTKLNGIAAGAQVNVIETVKVNGTALTVTSKAVDITAVPLTIITGADDLKAIEGLSGTGFLKRTGNNAWALDTTVVLNTRTITAGNGLTGGGDLSANRTINVASANAAITVNADNIQLNVINDYTTTTNNTIIPLAAARGKDLNDRLAVLESWFEVDSNGNVKTKDKPNNGGHRGFYTESFVSALGQNSQGGGGGDFSEEQMWQALQSNSGTYENAKINWNHIPLATTSTAGAIKVGSTLQINSSGVLNQKSGVMADPDVYTKVTVDTYGRVTQGGDLLADDIPTLSMSKISGLSTALGNVYTKTESDGKYVTALGTSGNYLTYTKNGNSNSITVPYATKANSLKSLGRQTSANLTHVENGGVQHFLASGSMTTAKPANDGHILHFHWDSAKGWDSQLFLSNDPTKLYLQYREENGNTGVWSDWITVLDTNNTSLSNGVIKINGNTITPLTAASNLAWSKVTGTPTTLSGYGITDAIKAYDPLMPTNTFSGDAGKFYLEPVMDCMWAADKRFVTSVTITDANQNVTTVDGASLFNGDFGGTSNIKAGDGNTIKIRIQANGDVETNHITTYFQGYLIVDFYYYGLPKSISGRIYSGAPNAKTWKNIEFSKQKGGGSLKPIYISEIGLNSRASIVEISIECQTLSVDPYMTMVSEVEWWCTRASVSQYPFLNKYAPQTLYYPLTTTTNVSVGGNLTVSGTTSLSSTLGVAGAATLSSTLSVADKIYTAKRLSIGADMPQRYSDRAEMYLVSKTDVATDFWIGNNSGLQWAISMRPSTDSKQLRLYSSNAGNGGYVASITTTGKIGIGTNSPSYKLDVNGTLGVASGITLTTTKKIKFGTANDAPYIELDSNGYFHFSAGLYSDSFVSALGANDQGGSSSGFDEEQMWKALNSSYDDNHLEIIDNAHLPNLDASKVTSGTFNASRIPTLPISKISGLQTALDSFATQTWVQNQGYATQSWVNTNFFAPTTSGALSQVLVSGGANNSPTWTNQSELIVKDLNITAFASGDDLNTFTDRGVWGTTSTSIVNSLLNKPTGISAGEARLEVLRCGNSNENYLFQRLWTRAGSNWELSYRSKASNWSSWVKNIDSGNFTNYTDAKYVTALGVSGNNLTWTKNGTTSNISVPYATKALYDANGINLGAYFYHSTADIPINNATTDGNVLHRFSIDNRRRNDFFHTISALAGRKNYLYCAHLNPSFQITSSGFSSVDSLFNHNISDNALISASVSASDPAIITIEYSGSQYLCFTDTTFLMFVGHQGGNVGYLKDYKVEILVVGGSTNSPFHNSPGWHTVVQRSGVQDELNGLILPIHLQSGYSSIKGLRLTINSVQKNITWTESFPISKIMLIDNRPAYTAAQGLNALDVSGGDIYGAVKMYSTLNVTGETTISSQLIVNGVASFGSSLYLSTNQAAINQKDSGGTNRNILTLLGNNLHLGYGMVESTHNTYIDGYNVRLTYGASRTIGLTLDSTGNTILGGNLFLTNDKSIFIADNPSTGSVTSCEVLRLTSANGLRLGHGTSSKGYDTYIRGHQVILQYGTTTGLTLGTNGNVTIHNILSANGGIIVPSGKTIKIGDATLSWDSTNQMLKVDKGFYSEGAVSALGSNSQGGGSGADLNAVWGSLTTHTDEFANEKIDNAHLNIAAWALAANKPSYAWSEITNKPTWIGASKPTYTFSEIGSTPTTLAGYGITDAASASSVTTLQSYFTNGVAKKAYHIEPMYSVTDTTIYTTVGEVKDKLADLIRNQGVGIGGNITVTGSAISKWNNDSAATFATNVYSMIKIGGGYSGSTYGQWLLSSYDLLNVGVVGRNGNAWSAIKWLPWTDGTGASGTWGISITGSATKLQTPRTIWGQSFDGSANVDGAFKAKKDLGGNLADWVQKQHDGVFEVGRDTNTMCVAIGVTDDNWGYIQSKGKNITSSGKLAIQPSGGDVYINSKVGIGTSSPSYNLHVSGTFRASTNANIGGTFSVGGATTLGSTLSVAGLLSANGNVKTTKLYLYKPNADDTNAVYLEYNSTNSGVHIVGAGLYSDSYVSALGANSSGGGGGDASLNAVWGSLTTYNDEYKDEVIDVHHIPNLSWSKITSNKPTTLSGYGILDAYTKTQSDAKYATISSLSDYATQTWVNQQGFVKSSGVTSVATGSGLTGGTITSTGTISIVSGFSSWANALGTWGTLKTANGYTSALQWKTSDGGEMSFAYKGGQISAQLDGYFYQNEGAYRVVDTSDLAAGKSWGMSITGSAAKLGTSTVGSSVRPIYLNNGTPTVASVESTYLTEPNYVSSGITPTTYSMIPTVRPNRWAFLPETQIIIEKTTDGGATWQDYGASDTIKKYLFLGNTKNTGINIPKLNGEKSKLCGIRVTITGMRYNVPDGTSETQKYSYWNSNYVASTERYCSIESMYIWVNNPYDRIRTRLYVSTGANPDTWTRADRGDSYLSGNGGGNIIFTLPNVTDTFGGGVNQTGNKWNYRIEFFTDGLNGGDLSTTTSGSQTIQRIQGYGRNGWTLSNSLIAIDHLYEWNEDQAAIFPNTIRPKTNNVGYLGIASIRWRAIYATEINLNGAITGATTGTFSSNVSIGGNIGVTGTSSLHNAIYVDNGKIAYWKDSGGTLRRALDLDSSNNLRFGYGTASEHYNSYIEGYNLYLCYGSAHTNGLTLDSSGNITTVGHTYMANGKAIYFKDSGGTVRNSIEFGANNVFSLGYGAGAAGYDTNLYGNRIYFRYGTSGTVGLTLGSSGAVIIPSTGLLKIGDCTIEWDSTNQMLKFDKGIYSTGAVSALGSNDEGGGSSDFSEELMWAALQSNTGTYANAKIDANHIPDTSSLYGYLKSSSLSGYVNAVSTSGSGNAVTSVTKSGNTITFTKGSTFLTSHQTLYTLSIYGGTTKVLDFKPNANASIYIKAGGDISLTNDTTNKYITLSYTHPTNGANTTISAANGKVLSAITVNSLGHVTSVSSKTLASADIPDISATYATASRATTLEGYFTDGVANNAAKLNGQAASYYATASSVTTLQGYFTDGVAKVAAKLNTGTTTYTAWGQTYWSSGVPQSISGNMTDVGTISASGNISVTKSTTSDTEVKVTNSNGSIGIITSTNRGVYDYTKSSWLITTNGTNTWLAQGNVGIGTTTPSKKLDVNGTLNASGAVTFGSTLGVTGATTLTGLLTANGNIKTGTSNGAYIQIGAIKLVYDSTNNALKVIKSDDSSANFYATGAVSALGANSSGGSSTFDEDSMWAALDATNEVIGSAHIPNLAASKITSGTFATARIPSLAASKITSGTFDTARIPNLSWNKITSDKPTTLDGYGITNAFSQTQCFNRFYSLYDGKEIEASSSSAVDLDTITDIGSYYCQTNTASGYVTNKPANRDIAFRMWVSAPTGTTAGYRRQRFQFYDQVAVYERIDTNLSSVSWGNWYKVQDSLADYASASDVTTLQGYFTNGVANSATTATKLSTVSKTAWGQTYWTSGGIPTNISGALSDVTNITMSGNIYLNNNQYIYTKDSGGTNRPVFYMTTNDNLYIGYGATAAGGATYVAGTSVELRYGSSRTTGLTLDSSGDVTVKGKVCVGTGGADSYLASDSADNIYLRNSSGAVLVCDGKVIRRSTSVSDVTLGSSSYPWGGVYSTTGTFSSNVSVGGTLDVTGAVTMSSNLTVTGWVRPIGNLVMGTSSNSMNADSGQIHFRTSYMTDFTKHCSPYIQAIGGGSYGRKRLSVFQNNGTSSDYNVAYSEVFTILANGRVGIGNTTPGALLGVSGDILASGEITASSDERKKNIISDTKFNVRDIASARSILYKWNDDRDKDNEKKIHGGSIAQDWLGKADSFLSQDNDGWYSINYGALALCSAITIAREVLKHGSEIDRLKQENERLKARVSELERRVA